LAQRIASFHQNTEIIHNSDSLDLQQKFNDLSAEKDYLREHLSMESSAIIRPRYWHFGRIYRKK
jgi:hypothetical protein